MSNIQVQPMDDGPLAVTGGVPVIDPDGRPFAGTDEGPVYLCRCGSSGNKPFCDGSHVRVGFTASDRAGDDLPS